MLQTLKTTCCHCGRYTFFHEHWTSVAPHPMSSASGRLSCTMANRMKINSTDTDPVMPGSAAFRRDAKINNATQQANRNRFWGCQCDNSMAASDTPISTTAEM